MVKRNTKYEKKITLSSLQSRLNFTSRTGNGHPTSEKSFVALSRVTVCLFCIALDRHRLTVSFGSYVEFAVSNSIQRIKFDRNSTSKSAAAFLRTFDWRCRKIKMRHRFKRRNSAESNVIIHYVINVLSMFNLASHVILQSTLKFRSRTGWRWRGSRPLKFSFLLFACKQAQLWITRTRERRRAKRSREKKSRLAASLLDSAVAKRVTPRALLLYREPA